MKYFVLLYLFLSSYSFSQDVIPYTDGSSGIILTTESAKQLYDRLNIPVTEDFSTENIDTYYKKAKDITCKYEIYYAPDGKEIMLDAYYCILRVDEYGNSIKANIKHF